MEFQQKNVAGGVSHLALGLKLAKIGQREGFLGQVSNQRQFYNFLIPGIETCAFEGNTVKTNSRDFKYFRKEQKSNAF